ncbi:hypothetical protein [Changchengzhania lutea]|uniref:hypothetical protein n=1 Tax=Changchengzhania lutea TaxID=2049305 RepID=UPI00115F6151|nr:hypothetical protein [Changchengzhania lutea]
MKHLLYVFALLIAGNVVAQEKPTEVKEETETKTVKVKDDEKTTERKVKVITRETSEVELDKSQKEKVNQDRVKSSAKVEKLVLVDNDGDSEYDAITKESYFSLNDEKYLFKPTNRGFDINYNTEADEFESFGNALSTKSDGYYIVNGKSHAGIGYFDKEGNFVVEYYNQEADQIEVKTYMKRK